MEKGSVLFTVPFTEKGSVPFTAEKGSVPFTAFKKGSVPFTALLYRFTGRDAASRWAGRGGLTIMSPGARGLVLRRTLTDAPGRLKAWSCLRGKGSHQHCPSILPPKTLSSPRNGVFAPFVRPTPQSGPWRRDRRRIVS